MIVTQMEKQMIVRTSFCCKKPQKHLKSLSFPNVFMGNPEEWKRAKRAPVVFLAGLLSLLTFQVSAFGQTGKRQVGEVKYVSSNAFYINLGTERGVQRGDSLRVVRRGRGIATLVVTSVARLSASCTAVSQVEPIKTGDRVEGFFRKEEVAGGQIGPGQQTKKKSLLTKSKVQPRKPRKRRQTRSANNRVRGSVSLQALSQTDGTSGNRDFYQMGVRSRLKVQQFMGLPVTLKVRWRSRSFSRDNVSSVISADEWRHNVYEFGVVSSAKNSNVEFGIGRVASNRIRGLGYIDGALFSYKVAPAWRLGVAGGTQPSLRTSGLQTAEQKLGLFLSYEKGEYGKRRFASTAAFSGRYNKGEVSREFVYLQNTFSHGSIFSAYQTIEVDLNRGWKSDAGRSSTQLSNFFLSTNFQPVKAISLNLSYDARKNVRIFETRSIPDSLFDEATRKGVRTGVVLRFPGRIRWSGTFGIRFRGGDVKNTTSFATGLSVQRILNSTATLNARLSYFNTMFTQAYRPSVSLRFSPLRGLSLSLAGGSYIYQTGNRETRNNWVEGDGTFRLNRRWFSRLGYRRFFGENQKAGRLFVEAGMTF